jgi:hypothetical protein
VSERKKEGVVSEDFGEEKKWTLNCDSYLQATLLNSGCEEHEQRRERTWGDMGWERKKGRLRLKRELKRKAFQGRSGGVLRWREQEGEGGGV